MKRIAVPSDATVRALGGCVARASGAPARAAGATSTVIAALILAALVTAGPASAEGMTPLVVEIARVSRIEEDAPLPLSLLDVRIENEGAAGAELGLADNATTGSFLGHEYRLRDVRLDSGDDVVAAMRDLLADGVRVAVLDLEAKDLLAAADAAPDALLMNVRATDDSLRNADCRANLLHLVPSRAMLTDALAQYLAWKRWDEIALVTGRHPEDAAWAAAFERAAKRFGLEIVDRADWTQEPGARRTDSGHLSVQSEIPVFTRFDDHDVLVVADEGDEFGEYLMWMTERPRPVAGTQGLVPTSWSRTLEQWGGTQLQRRFEALAGRWMTPRDYDTWMAIRALGEAVTSTSSNEPASLRDALLDQDLKLAGFKGVPLGFREWDGQLRQPILLTGPRMLVSVSPQEGYLHPSSELDTLGYDEPESACTAF